MVKGGRGGLPFHFSSVDENKGKRKKKREVGGRGSEWVGNGGNNKQRQKQLAGSGIRRRREIRRRRRIRRAT